MRSISKWMAILKLRLDLGGIFLSLINFALLIIATSSKFTELLRLQDIPHIDMIFTLVMIPVGFVLMIGLGQILIWMKYLENYSTEQNIRNPIYNEIFKELDEIKEMINKK
jgi:hypothetical protein